jgi:hypothetical protein
VAKEVPRERGATLRAALEETLRDERFLGEAQKQNLPLDPVSSDGGGRDYQVDLFDSAGTREAVKAVLQ